MKKNFGKKYRLKYPVCPERSYAVSKNLFINCEKYTRSNGGTFSVSLIIQLLKLHYSKLQHFPYDHS
jgi:hypothetical protein